PEKPEPGLHGGVVTDIAPAEAAPDSYQGSGRRLFALIARHAHGHGAFPSWPATSAAIEMAGTSAGLASAGGLLPIFALVRTRWTTGRVRPAAQRARWP